MRGRRRAPGRVRRHPSRPPRADRTRHGEPEPRGARGDRRLPRRGPRRSALSHRRPATARSVSGADGRGADQGARPGLAKATGSDSAGSPRRHRPRSDPRTGPPHARLRMPFRAAQAGDGPAAGSGEGGRSAGRDRRGSDRVPSAPAPVDPRDAGGGKGLRSDGRCGVSGEICQCRRGAAGQRGVARAGDRVGNRRGGGRRDPRSTAAGRSAGG